MSHLKSNRWGVGVGGESVFPWSQQNFPLGVPCSLKYQKLKQSLAFVPTNPALLFPIIFVTMFSQSLKPLGKSQYITLKIKRGYIFYIVTNSPLPTQELFGLIATVLVFVYYLFNKCMKKILDKRLATSSNPPTVHSECKIRTKWVTRMPGAKFAPDECKLQRKFQKLVRRIAENASCFRRSSEVFQKLPKLLNITREEKITRRWTEDFWKFPKLNSRRLPKMNRRLSNILRNANIFKKILYRPPIPHSIFKYVNK